MPDLIPIHDARPEPAQRTDSELLSAVRADDRDAFAEIVHRKTEPLLHLAFRIVGDWEEAKDLVQVAFLRAWEHRASYDSKWSANTWLYRITTNLGIDYVRSRSTRQRKAEPVRHHLRAVHSRPEGGFESLLAGETLEILRDLASNLTSRQRKAFWLREVEGLSSKEVADVLECKESTVRNHLFAARIKLRQELRLRFPEYAALARSDK